MRTEAEIADLIARYYRRKIGVLMQQADHWDKDDKPLAVFHRLHSADTYFQVVALFERMAAQGINPFDDMARELAREPVYPLGKYPPSQGLHEKYRDPRGTAFARYHQKPNK